MNTSENNFKVTDAAGTPIAIGDKVIWSPKSSTHGTPRKGIVMGISQSRLAPVATVTIAVITGGGTRYGRIKKCQVGQRVHRFVAAETGEYRHPQCIKAEWTLTDTEKKGIEYRQIRISASSIFTV